MCTLIVLHRCSPDAALVVAANRDEYLDRPAEPPALRSGGPLPVAAPLDLRAGGTWLGLNGAGLLAAVTNRPAAARDPERRSRGLLVLDALATRSAREAVRRIQRIGRDAANPFNLFVADGREAFALCYEGMPVVRPLAPGAHVIGNGDPDDRALPKIGGLLDRTEALVGEPSARALDALERICGSHEGGGRSLDDTCIHAGAYGTRSSALLRLGGEAAPLWRFADGPPCRTAYHDFTFLLHEIGRGDPLAQGGATTRSMS